MTHTRGAQAFLLQEKENSIDIYLIRKVPYSGSETAWDHQAVDCIGGQLRDKESVEQGLQRNIIEKTGLEAQAIYTLGHMDRQLSSETHDFLTILVACLKPDEDFKALKIDTAKVQEMYKLTLSKEDGHYVLPDVLPDAHLYKLYAPFLPQLMKMLNGDSSTLPKFFGQKDPEGGTMDVTFSNLEQYKMSQFPPLDAQDANALFNSTSSLLGDGGNTNVGTSELVE